MKTKRVGRNFADDILNAFACYLKNTHFDFLIVT